MVVKMKTPDGKTWDDLEGAQVAYERELVGYLCWANRYAEACGVNRLEREAMGLRNPTPYLDRMCLACDMMREEGISPFYKEDGGEAHCWSACHWAADCAHYRRTRRLPKFVRRVLYRRRAEECLTAINALEVGAVLATICE